MVALDQVENFRRQHEKSSVDRASIAARLFDKACHLVARALQRSVAPGRDNDANRGQLAVPVVKLDGCPNIQIADAVPIGETEGLLVLYVFCDALETPARQRVFACVDQHAGTEATGKKDGFHTILLLGFDITAYFWVVARMKW